MNRLDFTPTQLQKGEKGEVDMRKIAMHRKPSHKWYRRHRGRFREKEIGKKAESKEWMIGRRKPQR